MKNILFAFILLVLIVGASLFGLSWYRDMPREPKYLVTQNFKKSIPPEQQVMTIDQVWERRYELVDKTITFSAQVYSRFACDLSYCTSIDGCCNQCGGEYYVTPDNSLSDREGQHIAVILNGNFSMTKQYFGCMGDKCGYHCDPFRPDETYTIQGILREQQYEGDTPDGHDIFTLEYLGSR